MKTWTISIVTPSFNQGEFIEETIRSVLSQEGDFFIDYIIRDGGSTDNSVEVIKKYDRLLKEGKWPVKCRGIEYQWVSKKDEGQVDALEKGFARASGDIGAWLNSDDIFYNYNVFETVARYFKEGEIDLVIGDGVNMDRYGTEIGVHHTDRVDLKELIFLDYHILQPSVFFKMDLYRRFPLDKSFHNAFDADFFIRLVSSGAKYKKVSDRLSCFRIYPECKTMSERGRLVRETMAIARKMTDNSVLLLACRIYKYLTFVVQARYADSRFVRFALPTIKNFFYLLILGTWGRK